jgi:signal transduction histidine kinase
MLPRKTDYIQRRTDLKIPYGDNSSISLDINISRITKSTVLDRKEGYTFLLRDITQQKNLDDEKDLFIHEVSHELRTPITVAEGEMSMAIMMVEKPQPNLDEIKHTITRGHDQVVFLGEMINDLSALSRATQDSKVIKVEEFSIADILTELETNYKPQAEKKGLYLKIDLAPSIPKVNTSRLYFKEILDNFITNAIKYTEKGGITVTGQAIDRDHIMLSVKDTGIGISKSEQDKVYQKFWRSEDPLTRKSSGTGLGLYVTQQLAGNIGAEVKLQSEPKKGSTFSLIMSTKGKAEPMSKSPLKRFFKFSS